jgi:ssDNA-binding Zn-finger/Zn-ribbon topoisomerase 1
MLERTIEEKLNGHPTCSHCQEQAALKLLPRKGMMIGCYACPSGYVSRIVTYGKELDLTAFRELVSSFAKGVSDVNNEDVRVATRYTWDLGIGTDQSGMVLKEAYWMQSYRRTKNDDPKRLALFLCGKCGSFYNQAFSELNKLCPQCRGLSS